MLFLIYTVARPGCEEIIRRLHSEHRAYMEPHSGDVYLGGPLLGPDSRSRVGGLLVMEFADLEEARRFAFEQPYAAAGIIEELKVHPFVPFIERGAATGNMTPPETADS